ncbi:carbohydrate ABC transporter substrate-binding protein (CUT1 family) [Glaciihabitans tibetensis]|uniref:Carbohydrate ABC transporter substrate-binding protein (CUT1 family) n=1 Tax=Glaciihabitans tibetensis TaxID=1266600 RepID=A0A2T0VE40_9MICO|nr:extracellular solute-binding protein [Glaciihabitans tibetensis]PRY68402.1 carbohydrate ABC transporter substrate-binding protein (CUT1 family) [Glaciihabitans tibetensis]
MIRIFNRRRALAGSAAAVALALTLGACSSSDNGGNGGGETETDVAAALEQGGDLLVWGWDATLPPMIEAFEEAYPNVNVELANVGTGTDAYTALQNAIQAGSGIPDVVHMEYSAVPQFALTEDLADLTPFGAADLEDSYTPGTWGSVAIDDGVYGLPLDSGPMAMFYNATVFEENGIAVPETWEQYVEAARTLHTADPSKYMVGDAGDAGFVQSMIWQADGRPFQSEGTDVTVDLGDDGSNKFAEMWQPMLDEDLVAPVVTWSDEWYKALGDGTINTLLIGAWMPVNLESGVPEAAGNWRAAPMPQYTAGDDTNAENGGSALVVTEASAQQALAYGFTEFSNSGDGVGVRLEAGTFPATVADIESPEFTGKEFPYFGGQKVNEVLAAAATSVSSGWQYLPFQAYAVSIFNDNLGKSYTSDQPLTEGLASWQDAIVSYGNNQGFTVNGG